MTWVPLYSSTEFQYNSWSPFFRSPWQRRKYPHVAAWVTRRSIQSPRSYSPLWAIFIKLVSQITLSLLDRFWWFQLCCVPFENIFLMTYHMSGYVKGIPRKACKQRKQQVPFLIPQSRYGSKDNTVRIIRINQIFWDGCNEIWNTSGNPDLSLLVYFLEFCKVKWMW